MAFVFSYSFLFFPSYWCLGKAVLRDYDISWVSALIYLRFRLTRVVGKAVARLKTQWKLNSKTILEGLYLTQLGYDW